jgi:hypothetical protein
VDEHVGFYGCRANTGNDLLFHTARFDPPPPHCGGHCCLRTGPFSFPFALDWCDNGGGSPACVGIAFGESPTPVLSQINCTVRAPKPELQTARPYVFLLENHYLLMVTRPYLEQLDRLPLDLRGLTRREISCPISGLSCRGRPIYTHDGQLTTLPPRHAITQQ